jgi:membrane-bound lytic murein transglycosylase D
MVYMMYYAKDYQLYPGTPKINIKDATFYKINEKQSLKYLAELSGTDEETLKIYNPALKKGIVPKTDEGFSILLPRQIAFNLDKKVDLLAQDPYIYNPAYIPPPTIPIEPIIANETLAESSESTKPNEVNHDNVEQKNEPVKVSSIISNINSKSNKEFKIVKIVETKKVIDYHKVRKGENATEIARKYQISLDDLSEWNKKANLKKLLVGSKLKIEKTIKEVKPQLMPVTNKSNLSYEDEEIVHKLKRGETLLQLTRKYNVTLNDLRAWNSLEDDNVLIGQEIVIKTNKNKLESNNLQQYFIHIAKGGDTLQSASNLYNVPVETLKKLNNIPENVPLKEGEKIKIPSS